MTQHEAGYWISYELRWPQHTYSRNVVACLNNWKCAMFHLKKRWGGAGELRPQSWKDETQFLGLTGSPYRSLWESNMEYQLFAKGGEGCSQLLQIEYSGKTQLYIFQINSLDFNANKTGRVLVSISQSSQKWSFTWVWFQKYNSKMQHHRHISFGH